MGASGTKEKLKMVDERMVDVRITIEKAQFYEKANQLEESLSFYHEGISNLMTIVNDPIYAKKKEAYKAKALELIQKAERVKSALEVQKKNLSYREERKIAKGSKGHSYVTIFGPYCSDKVEGIRVEDPYIRSHYQIQNFLRFCELVVKKCPSLKSIVLLTGTDKNPEEQEEKLNAIKASLSDRYIKLTINFSDTLHDRTIRFNTGWTFKIGRGLNFYLPPRGPMSIGQFDLDLRPCHETTVDIFHTKSLSVVS